MTKRVTREQPLWFYLFFALGLFVTLNTYIGAQGHGNAQTPLLLYVIILGAIIAKYHVFRWRSIPVAMFSLLILYGATGSFLARVSGGDLSYFTAMGLGIIVVSLHFLPRRAVIDYFLIKKFLYYSALIFVISRIGRLLADDYIVISDAVLFLTHEVAFLLPFVFLIPLFERKWARAFTGLILVTLFLVVDFRTTTFLIYLTMIVFAVPFMVGSIRTSLRKLGRILLILSPGIVTLGFIFSDVLFMKIREVDMYFREHLGRVDTQSFREQLNELALENISNNPWIGDLFQGQAISIQHYYFGVWRTDPVHNVFLAIGTQGGLVFLLPFVVLLLSLLITGARTSAQYWARQPEGAKLLGVLVVALASAIISGMVNPFLGYAMGAFWFWTIIMLIYLVKDQMLVRVVMERTKSANVFRNNHCALSQ